MKEAKEKWLKVIKEDYEELTPFTKCNFSGIYMIFIDNFEDKNIIPIYIGETKNFQHRHREHITKLFKLNRMNYDEYCNYIRSKEAEHDYLYCKIFKYLVDNNLTLDNLHMIIIDKQENLQNLNEEEKKHLLKEIERQYINYFQSDIFGFNALYSLSEKFESMIPDQAVYQDIKKIAENCDYGYNIFNAWNIYKTYKYSTATYRIISKKIIPIIKENLYVYDDNGTMMADKDYRIGEYLNTLESDYSKIKNRQEEIKQEIQSKVENLLKDRNYNSNYLNQYLQNVFYHLGLDNLGFVPNKDVSIYKNSKKFVDENNLKESLKKLIAEYVEINKRSNMISKSLYGYITEDNIIKMNAISHPSKTFFKYILPIKKFDKYIISKKFVSPLELINFPKNKEDINIIIVISSMIYYPRFSLKDEYIVYIGAKYNNIKINKYIIPADEQEVSILTEYYTTLNDEKLKNRENENSEFEHKFSEIINCTKGNLNIRVIGAGHNAGKNRIYEYLKDKYNFDNKSRLNIKLLKNEND